MEYGYDSGYGYQDYYGGSAEAYQNSWDAYNAGDMQGMNYWNDVSAADQGAGNAAYYGGADAYGSYSAGSEGYYGDYSGAGYDAGASYGSSPVADDDYGASASLISTNDMTSVL